MSESFEEFERNIAGCEKCELCKNRTNIVCGSGDRSARVMFVGEGPGNEEDSQGVPFVGNGGILMDHCLRALDIDREKIYLTNVIKCRPPMNRKASQEEITVCLDYLRDEVKLVKPEVVVLMGNVALKAVLGNQYSVTAFRGQWVELGGIKFFVTYHPAALFRDEDKKIDFMRDLKEIKEFV